MKRALPALVLAVVMNALGSPALALDSHLRISQYGHSAWRNRDGFFAGSIIAVAQTRDGYLWFATASQLFRFDGIRFEPLDIAGGPLATAIVGLFGSSDGSLWIGTGSGLYRWHAGVLTRLADKGRFESFVEDASGTVWTGNTRVPVPIGPLCRFNRERFWCVGRGDTIPLKSVLSLHVDASGAVWAGGDGSACRFTGGAADCFAIPVRASDALWVGPIASDSQGIIAAARQFGLWRFSGDRWIPARVPGLDGTGVAAMLRDRIGNLWVGTSHSGLVRMTSDGVDSFTSADGLSGDEVQALYEDVEENLWVVTSGGVDRLRNMTVKTITKREGLLEDNVVSIAPSRAGGVWITGWSTGIVGVRADDLAVLRAGRELPPTRFDTSCEDPDGRLWIGTVDGLGWVEYQQMQWVTTPDGLPFGLVNTIACDSAGHVWAATVNPQHALVRLSNGHISDVIKSDTFAGQQINNIVADPNGGVWLAGNNGTVMRWQDGAPLRTIATLGRESYLRSMFVDQDGVWGTTRGGLVWMRDGQLARLDERNGLPCRDLTGLAKANDGSLWFKAACGLITITSADAHAWLRDPSRRVATKLYDAFDGAVGSEVSNFTPMAARSSDGVLWFVEPHLGIQVVDPGHLSANTRTPPVLVTRLIADRKQYALTSTSMLPARVKDLEIDYTALSYKIPERVRFRYVLEGVDAEWQEAGARREAFYMNLKPGRYRFRVRASNDAGVWNEAGASLEFVIPPTFVQTIWFDVLAAGLFAGLLWTGYTLRLRSVTREIHGRMEERLQERERIARELHDTLLQGTYGLVLRFQAVADQIDHADPVRQSINDALERADKVVAEGRDRVEGLRLTVDGPADLPTALREAGGDAMAGRRVDLHIDVQGEAQEIQPIVRDEIFWIGREAIANAANAAECTRIEVVLGFDRHELRLTVRDDGLGIDRNILESGGRPKHWGIRGMRERATRIGGRLKIASEPNAGTTVELRVPARFAYVNASARPRFWLWRRSAH